MALIRIDGATPGGLAAAARLGKVGHDVILGGGDGGHWARDLPPVVGFPAVWRDLFTKSGRSLDAVLATHRLELTAAPPVRHEFADGSVLDLPAERGGQYHAIAAAYGAPAADRWTALCDELDTLWQALRMRGLERPAPEWTRADRAAVWGDRRLGDLAARLREPHLAALVTLEAARAGSSATGDAPALLASRIVVDRVFGHWLITGLDAPVTYPGTVLVSLLADRARQRSVPETGVPGTSDTVPDAVLDAVPSPSAPAGLLRRPAARPASAPSVTVTSEPDASRRFGETVRHTPAGPIISWTWRGPDDADDKDVPRGLTTMTHDHTAASPDPAWGLAPDSLRAWTARPGLRAAQTTPEGPPTWHASAASPGGNEPWAELLAGALATYDLHESVTGLDIRPTNRQQPPRPRNLQRAPRAERR